MKSLYSIGDYLLSMNFYNLRHLISYFGQNQFNYHSKSVRNQWNWWEMTQMLLLIIYPLRCNLGRVRPIPMWFNPQYNANQARGLLGSILGLGLGFHSPSGNLDEGRHGSQVLDWSMLILWLFIYGRRSYKDRPYGLLCGPPIGAHHETPLVMGQGGLKDPNGTNLHIKFEQDRLPLYIYTCAV